MSDADRSKHWTAGHASIPYTTFNRKLKAGGGDFTLAELWRIAVALGVRPRDLLPFELEREVA